MYYLLLICSNVVGTIAKVIQKQYNLKVEKPNVLLFSAITSLMGLCFFVVTSGFQLEFDVRLIPYSLCYAVAYAVGWVGLVNAVRYELLAITWMIINSSLIFPTVYGLLLGEIITPVVASGIALLFVSIVLVNVRMGDGGRFSKEWFFWTMLGFLGNGGCQLIQNMYKRALGESYNHEFMIIALAVAAALLMVFAYRSSSRFGRDFKKCAPFASVNGIANATTTLLMLIMIGNIPNTILYPTNSALGMVMTFLVAVFLYREKFSKVQYVGYTLGIVSAVLLNI